MKLSTAQKVMKIVGILTVIGGLIVVGLGALILYGLKNDPEITSSVQTSSGTLLFSGITLIVLGLVDVVTGILAVLANKNGKYAKTTFILAIVSAVYSVANSLMTYAKEGFNTSNVISLMVELVLSVLLCVAANTVKVAYEEGRDA
ncbi:MAG: hypothetical protein IK151_03895 [Erysipelotrichaceae bacterium]|nr:hypothetical protein [Erysipelotrichaceae bacterium]